MKKVFITAVPLQPEGKLKSTQYNSQGNQSIAYEKPTRFPIMHLIANNVEENDNIEILVITPETENANRNLKFLEAELAEFKKEITFNYTMKFVKKYEKENKISHMKLYSDIVKALGNEQIIYADMTYGTKTTPMILFSALNFAYKIEENVDINTIVYGSMDFGTENADIYDVTSLLFINSIVENLSKMDVKNPKELLLRVIGV